MLGVDDLFGRFGRLETERLDFKVQLPKDLGVTLAAMANTSGGHVVLGVTDGRDVPGVVCDQRLMDDVARAAQLLGLDCPREVLTVRRDDGRVVDVCVVSVPEVADRVVTTSDGRVMRRAGSSNSLA